MEFFTTLFKAYTELVSKVGVMNAFLSISFLVFIILVIKYGMKVLNYFFEKPKIDEREKIHKENEEMIQLLKDIFHNIEIVPNIMKFESIVDAWIGINRNFYSRLKQFIFTYWFLKHERKDKNYLESEIKTLIDNCILNNLKLFFPDSIYMEQVSKVCYEWIKEVLEPIEVLCQTSDDMDKDEFRKLIDDKVFGFVENLSHYIYAEYSITILKEKYEYIKMETSKK